MERLNGETLLYFVNRRGAAAVMFGSPTGRVTMLQAHAFADVWADHAGEACFGYIDAAAYPQARTGFLIGVLPTVLVFRDGDLVRSLEGFHSRRQIAAALNADLRFSLDVWRPAAIAPATPKRTERVCVG